MIKFIVKHPIAVLLALLLHVTIVVAFNIQWNEPEVIKVSSQGSEPQEIKQITQIEPMKTFTVDASQVQAQLTKLKADQEAKRLEQKLLAAKTDKERLELKELQKKYGHQNFTVLGLSVDEKGPALVNEFIEKENITRVAEIGVGSGAISIVLARKFPQLHIIATDICDTPLKVAEQNIKTFGLSKQIELRKSNLLDDVREELDLVVSNPPYIAEDFLLDSNVVDYEPQEALFGGKVGDELLKQIILDVKAKGVKYLACEMGYDQKEPLQGFVNEIGVEYIRFYKDLAGFDRGFVIKFNEGK